MTNAPLKTSKWPLWASIIALVLAVFGLCAGIVVPWGSLLCPLIAIVLAITGLKTQRKALPIVALVISVLSFCTILGAGAFIWTSPEYATQMSTLGGSLGNLFQSIILLIKTMLKIP